MSIPATAFGLVPGVYNVGPTNSQGKTLVVDLSCFIAGARTTRNVLKTRNTAQNQNGSFMQQSFELLQAGTGQAPTQMVVTAPANNVATIVSSDMPVHIIVTTNNGTLDLGQNTLFILTNPIVSLKFINDSNIGTTNINCLIM